jgi:hypothetical protein
VAAGLDALDDERVGARACGGERLVDLGHGHPRGEPALVQARHDRRVRTAERERHDRDPLLEHELELRGEVVVVEARLAELDAVRARLGLESARVGGHALPVDRGLLEQEQVDAEGLSGQLARPGDVRPDGIRALVARREEAESARSRDGGRQLGRRRPACERRLDDRTRERGKRARHREIVPDARGLRAPRTVSR